MKTKEDNPAIPRQHKGNELDAEYSITAPSTKEALLLFLRAIDRLLSVNNWQALSNSALSAFQLTDANGSVVHREAREHDFFKIKIPGPGNASGDGYDWVKVELIKNNMNNVTMRVRPVANPFHPEKGTAHFFQNDATSTFSVFRRGRIVTAGVYGRNEIPNVKSPTILNKIRNATIAMGAFAGASRIQWESLIQGILNEPKRT